jgi:hypothetical protein
VFYINSGEKQSFVETGPLLRLWRRSLWTDGIISYGTVLFWGQKSTEKTTERKERRFRAVSVRAF